MSTGFLSRLQKGAVLCDGAMGTLLYAKGIFINRCYDELNLSAPDLIRGIHQDYLKAGAEVIETNTFGANSFRLSKHGCVDKLVEINRQGARLAREATKNFDALVAGAVGPLGVRIEPLGKIALAEARDAFRQQIAALNEEGVDLLILETFGYLEELHQAILAARDVNPELPVVAQVTIDEDGNCLDGSSPEHYGPQTGSLGSRRHRLQLQRGPGRHAGRAGAGSRGHHHAAFGPAQRRHSALRRRPQHLSLLAGVHGELHGAVRQRRRSPDWRLLRHHARAHPHHEAVPEGGCGARIVLQGRQDHRNEARRAAAVERTLCPRPQGRRRRVRHHGGDRSAARHRRQARTGRREVPEVGWRGRDQYSRQSSRLGPPQQPGAVPAGEAGSGHRAGPALHLPRSQRAGHSVGPAGRQRRRHSQPDLHHRRSAEDGRLSRRDRGLRRGLDRSGQHRSQSEPRSRHRRQSDRKLDRRS